MDVNTQGTRAYELQAQPISNLSERAMAEIFDVARGELEGVRAQLFTRTDGAVAAFRAYTLAGSTLVVALGALGVAVVVGLSSVVALWLAASIVAILFALASFAFARAGEAAVTRLLPPSNLTPDETKSRTDVAYQDLDRTVNAIAQRNTPLRDAILAGVGTVIALVVQARNGRR